MIPLWLQYYLDDYLKKKKKKSTVFVVMRVVFMCATFYDTESSLLLRIVK